MRMNTMHIRSKQLYEWQQKINNKRQFDPLNKRDKAEFTFFLRNDRWQSTVCPFILEWPYLTIPDMIKDKLTRFWLKAERGEIIE